MTNEATEREYYLLKRFDKDAGKFVDNNLIFLSARELNKQIGKGGYQLDGFQDGIALGTNAEGDIIAIEMKTT